MTASNDVVGRVAALFDQVADTFENVGMPWFGPIAEGLVREVAPRDGEHVVDLGCGRGAALFPAARAVGPGGRVIGIDVSSQMVELVRGQARELGLPQIDVWVMDASVPDLPAGSVDVVLASLVLFFLPRPRRALRSWTALLRPGGRLGISTFAEADENTQRLEAVFQPYLSPELLHERTGRRQGPFGSDEGVRGLFADAGLQDVRTTHFDAEIGFLDVDAWATWSRSHGQRAVWQCVPDGDHPAVLAEAADILAEGRDHDGLTRLRQRVRYTIGRAPRRNPEATAKSYPTHD